MKTSLFILGATLCLTAPLAGAADYSWDPLKDVESVLPEGVPNEGKIIQARHQVREMSQDALASLYEILPGARRAIERSAGMLCSAPSASSFSSPAARQARAWSSTNALAGRPS